jgi:hypothetical protein
VFSNLREVFVSCLYGAAFKTPTPTLRRSNPVAVAQMQNRLYVLNLDITISDDGKFF